MKTSIFTSILHCLLFAFCASNCALLAEAKHGFKIVNKTAFPLQVSLNQVGPLYWGTVEPGKTFQRRTGAVWFTIKSQTYIEGASEKITTKDAIFPVAKFVGKTLLAAFTVGTSAVASAAAGGAGALSSSIAGVSGALVGAGIPAKSALAIGGAIVGGSSSAGKRALSDAMKKNLEKVFSKKNVTASKAGCYARNCPTYEITGGPRFDKMKKDGKEVANLVGSPMKIRKV